MARRPERLAPLLVAAVLLGGCADVSDPYRAEGRWRPSGVNEANLRAMLAEPRDVVRGRGTTEADGQRAAAPVERLRGSGQRASP